MPLEKYVEEAIEKAATLIAAESQNIMSKSRVLDMIRMQFMTDGSIVTAKRILENSSRMDLVSHYCSEHPGEMVYLAKVLLEKTK